MKCHVTFDLPMGGVRLYFVDERNGRLYTGTVGEGGYLTWVERDDFADFPEASLALDQRATEALLEGVLAYARSREGYVPTDARKDYLAERARVDGLIAVLAQVAQARVVP